MTASGIFDRLYLGNSLADWAAALGTAIVIYVLISIMLKVVGSRLEKFSKRTRTNLDDLIVDLIKVRTRRILMAGIAFYGGSTFLVLPQSLEQLIRSVAFLCIAVQLGFWGNGVINYLVSQRATSDGEDGLNLGAYSVIVWIAKASLWTIVILLALNNLGIEITALVAGLGISGIAVALAVQNILGDLFSSLSIILDRPFVVGDFIIVGEQKGTVEHVGLKTTRVRSLSGEQIVFSNSDLLGSRIRNLRRMNERRVLFNIGVIYQTSVDKLEKIPVMIREAIENQKMVRFDRSHFSGFGDSALDFETVYWILDRDYTLYRDIQQGINLELFRRFGEEGIEFAYPTQTLFIEKE
jgi:small-conductance mechanosensitive channel